MRPIDANAVLQAIKEIYCKGCNSYNGVRCRACEFDDAMSVIDDAPTLDYAPVRRGEFERQPEEYIVGLHVNPVLCKTCDTTYFTLNKDGKRTVCCPYCGAKMMEDGKSENA